MPAPGEQIHARTQERDAMFGRMASMAEKVTGCLSAEAARKTAPSLVGLEDKGTSLILGVEPGAVLATVGAGAETRSVLEEVLRTYSNIAAAGATPDHRWRDAPHFRPYWALGALVDEVEALVARRVADALRVSGRADTGSAS